MERRKTLRRKNYTWNPNSESPKKPRDEREESPDLPLITIKNEREARPRELRVSLHQLNIIFCSKCYQIFTTTLELEQHKNVCSQKEQVQESNPSDDKLSLKVQKISRLEHFIISDDDSTSEDESQEQIVVSDDESASGTGDERQEQTVLSADDKASQNQNESTAFYFEEKSDKDSKIPDSVYFSEMCPFCGAMDTSMEHLSTKHPQNMQKLCWICLTWFNKISANVHMSTVHRLPMGAKHCQICGKLCTNQTVEAHIASVHINMKKAYQCIDCSQIFRNESALQCHHRLQHIIWDDKKTKDRNATVDGNKTKEQTELKITNVFSLNNPDVRVPIQAAPPKTVLSGQSGKLYDQLRQMRTLPLGQRYVLIQTRPGVLALTIVSDNPSSTKDTLQQDAVPTVLTPTLVKEMPVITEVTSGPKAELKFSVVYKRLGEEQSKELPKPPVAPAIPTKIKSPPANSRLTQVRRPVDADPAVQSPLIYNKKKRSWVPIAPKESVTTYTQLTPVTLVSQNPKCPSITPAPNSNGSNSSVNHALSDIANSLTSELLIKDDPDECEKLEPSSNSPFSNTPGTVIPISFDPGLSKSTSVNAPISVIPICRKPILGYNLTNTISPVSNTSASLIPVSVIPISNMTSIPISDKPTPVMTYSVSSVSNLAVSTVSTADSCIVSISNSVVPSFNKPASILTSSASIAPFSSALMASVGRLPINQSQHNPKPPQPSIQAPAMCPMCGANDTSKEHFLAKHMGDMLYLTCRICFTPFGRKSMLYNHIQQVHTFPGCRKYCQICGEEFREREISANMLKEHIEKAHGALRSRVRCVVCKMMLINEFAMSYHLMLAHGGGSAQQEHSVCMLCDSTFPYSMYLHDHMLAKHGDIGVMTASEVANPKTLADITRRRKILPMSLPSNQQPLKLGPNIPNNNVTFPTFPLRPFVSSDPKPSTQERIMMATDDDVVEIDPLTVTMEESVLPGTAENNNQQLPGTATINDRSLPDTVRINEISLPDTATINERSLLGMDVNEVQSSGSDGNAVISLEGTDSSDESSSSGTDGSDECSLPDVDEREQCELSGTEGNECIILPMMNFSEESVLPGMGGNEDPNLSVLDGDDECVLPGMDEYEDCKLPEPLDSEEDTDRNEDSTDTVENKLSLPGMYGNEELPGLMGSEELSGLMGSEDSELPMTSVGSFHSPQSEHCLLRPESPVGSDECILPDL